MKNFLPHISLLWLCLLLAGCADDPVSAVDDGPAVVTSDPVGQPVLFSSGNLREARTRADAPVGSTTPFYLGMTSTTGVPYMAENGRFVCTMYYHPKSTDTDASDFDVRDAEEGGTATTAWLRVNNNVGNSVYWNKNYPSPYTPTLDDYGFDKSATMFYWQNRLTHAFLALADYNKLSTNDGATNAQGKLKMYPYGDRVTGSEKVEDVMTDIIDPTYNTYDLTRGSCTSITGQPDPILALTIMKPAGATQEANRVRLYFRHQFSQIQVNIKGSEDSSAEISANQIDGVELLGISTEGYVCNQLNADGTLEPSVGKDVHLDEFSDAVLDENQWGTSFQMFDMATGTDTDGIPGDDGYAIGFLRSFNAIAFGMLRAIRITWHEGTTASPGIEHVSTFEIARATAPTGDDGNPVDLVNLQSNMRYVYDLELRRGTLAVIRTQILDWMQKEDLVYQEDGKITN